jgi:hypothetical protein
MVFIWKITMTTNNGNMCGDSTVEPRNREQRKIENKEKLRIRGTTHKPNPILPLAKCSLWLTEAKGNTLLYICNLWKLFG